MSKAKSEKLKAKSYKKILVIRLDRIGDVVLSTPVIKALRDAMPDSHIAFMVRPYARDIVEGNPYLSEVIVYDKSGPEKSIAGNLKFIKNLRKNNFDLALILHPTVRTHLVAFLAGIPERVGYDKKRAFLLTKRIPHAKQLGLKHELDYNLDLLRYIGIEAKDRVLHMPVNKESEARIEALFEKNGINKNDFVITVNPGASCVSKRWRAENFAKAADLLSEKFGAKVAVISGRTDKAFGDAVASSVKRGALNLSGQTSVADIASVLRRSRLFISNDSGPVHIACAVGTPVVVIFGRGDRGLSPRRWGPTGAKSVVLHKDVGCDPCLAHNCKLGFRCLEAVTVDEVVAAAEKALRHCERPRLRGEAEAGSGSEAISVSQRLLRRPSASSQ